MFSCEELEYTSWFVILRILELPELEQRREPSFSRRCRKSCWTHGVATSYIIWFCPDFGKGSILFLLSACACNILPLSCTSYPSPSIQGKAGSDTLPLFLPEWRSVQTSPSCWELTHVSTGQNNLRTTYLSEEFHCWDAFPLEVPGKNGQVVEKEKSRWTCIVDLLLHSFYLQRRSEKKGLFLVWCD